MEKTEVTFHPLPINILRLQNFTHYFDLTEITMLNWFVVKGRAFKYNQFYYSYRRISDETHIKEDRLKTIVKRFEKEGIVNTEIKGLPKTSWFTVNYSTILELVPYIFVTQFAENSKLIAYFSKLSAENSKHKGKYNKESRKDKSKVEFSAAQSAEEFSAESNSYNLQDLSITANLNGSTSNPTEKEEWSEEDYSLREYEDDINMVIQDLNKVYKERVEIFNQAKEGRKKTPIGELAFNRKSKLLLLNLIEQISCLEDINYSFMAYIDSVLADGKKIDKLIPYFLFQDNNVDFRVFQDHLDRFATKYYTQVNL